MNLESSLITLTTIYTAEMQGYIGIGLFRLLHKHFGEFIQFHEKLPGSIQSIDTV